MVSIHESRWSSCDLGLGGCLASLDLAIRDCDLQVSRCCGESCLTLGASCLVVNLSISSLISTLQSFVTLACFSSRCPLSA